MVGESDPLLPPGYIPMDMIAKRAGVPTPKLQDLLAVLQKEGYVAARSHVEANAVKTNCPMAVCLDMARALVK